MIVTIQKVKRCCDSHEYKRWWVLIWVQLSLYLDYLHTTRVIELNIQSSLGLPFLAKSGLTVTDQSCNRFGYPKPNISLGKVPPLIHPNSTRFHPWAKMWGLFRWKWLDSQWNLWTLDTTSWKTYLSILGCQKGETGIGLTWACTSRIQTFWVWIQVQAPTLTLRLDPRQLS